MLRSLILLPILALVASGCSQNPHVDISDAPLAKTSANALQNPRIQDPPTVTESPDRDRDGVPNVADECPDEPGPAENNGCPYPEWQDHDKDGTPDADDACPTEPGPAENNGCPYPEADRDHDGTPDQHDKCPELAGQIFNDGCPIGQRPVETDSDGDGTPDQHDKCPYEAGQIFNDGCPLRELDTDGDGIPDTKDYCPRLPGPACNRGCPYPREEERHVLLDVRESLKFDFDKATIKLSSYPALHRLVRFLKKYPDSQIRMVGHTDDVGTDEYNMGLSQARVFAVRDFLTEQGIADYRIAADFRGERQPLVRADGLEGDSLERARAKNRRVDMSIHYELVVR